MTAATSIETEQHQQDTEEIKKNKMERIKLKKANKKSKKAAKDKKKETQTAVVDTEMTTTKNKEDENVDHEEEGSNDGDQNDEVSSPPSKDSNGKKTKKSKKTKKKKRSHEKKSNDVSSDNNDESTGGDDDANMEDSETTTHLSGKTTESQEDDDRESNTHSDNYDDERGGGDDGGDERKVFLTRIPTKFDADTITRLFELSFGEGCVDHIALPLTRNEDDEDGEGSGIRGRDGKSMSGGGGTNADRGIDKRRRREEEDEEGEHRGFGFVTMASISKRDEAIEKGTIRGSVKETSKKKHTLYIRSVVRPDHEDGKETSSDGGGLDNVCYLWSKSRCPYGDTCKFKHVGEGGCLTVDKNTEGTRKKKQKCFKFQSKGGCTLGDKCPYSHDADVITPGGSKKDAVTRIVQEKKDKDCINWKTKGKCRKMDKCPYRHDEAVRDARLAKKRGHTDKTTDTPSSKKRKANPQPLSIRVFGLNYDTKVSDIREYFGHCGFISEVTFPVYEDSGRSKGYCGILFTSPKATEKACELDGKELLGRWLSVQPGKMYLKQWAEREQVRLEGRKNVEPGNEGDEDGNIVAVQNVGEFGQKVKTRKKHGFKE